MVEYRGTYIKTSPIIPLVPGLLLVSVMLALLKILLFDNPDDARTSRFSLGGGLIALYGVWMIGIPRIQVDEQGLWFPNLWTGIRMKHIPWNEINSIRYELVSGFRWPNLVLDREGQDKPYYVALPALSKKLRLQLMEHVDHYMGLKARAERQAAPETHLTAQGS